MSPDGSAPDVRMTHSGWGGVGSRCGDVEQAGVRPKVTSSCCSLSPRAIPQLHCWSSESCPSEPLCTSQHMLRERKERASGKGTEKEMVVVLRELEKGKWGRGGSIGKGKGRENSRANMVASLGPVSKLCRWEEGIKE